MATVVRWEPFREIASLQNEMSRFMNGLLEGNGRTTQAWIPALDVWETESEIVYALDLPGVPEEKISVELDEGALTIAAERGWQREDGDQSYFGERYQGSFRRQIQLGDGLDLDQLEADLHDGVLTVRIPVAEKAKPRRIEVNQSGATAPQSIETTSVDAS